MRKTICQIVPVLLCLLSCVDAGERAAATFSLAEQDTIEVRYAREFEVDYREDGIHLTIHHPETEMVITQPTQRFICTTALQAGNFEVLGLEDRIVGINSLKSLFSEKIREQIEDGRTVRIGREGVFDTEAVLAARPDYILVSASKHGGFDALTDCGIPLIPHHGYRETDPLGQAEWIKLIGLLTGQTRKANEVFAEIESQYLALRDSVARLSSPRPTVASGRQVREGWYAVGGRSYMARLFADAGADYLMADDTNSGGVTLDFEAAYARFARAEWWQTDGMAHGGFTLQALADEDPRYATMAAHRRGQVLFCDLSTTPYRELAGVQPQLLLADLVAAFHPEALTDYTPTYYKQLR